MRVLIGMTEIASFIAEFTAALRAAGFAADSLVLQPNRFYPANVYTYRYDPPPADGIARKLLARVVGRFVRLWYLARLMRRYDVFVFVWSDTFLPFMADLAILRLLGKHVIVFNCGDDVRFRPIQNRIEQHVFGIERFDPAARAAYEQPLSSNGTFLRRFFTQRIEEWSKVAIVTTRNQATFQKKSAFVFRFPTRRLLAHAREPRPGRPLIVHAPTDRAVKGTAAVLEAIDLLRARGLDFDFELIEGRDNEYVMSRLLEADILVDQPGTWIGRLGCEALAASCAVVGGNDHEFEAFPGASPVVRFESDPARLASTLERLVADRDARADVMRRSFAFWEENYSYERFASFFREVLSGTAAVLPPLARAKDILVLHACNGFQRAVVRLFY